MTDKAKKTWKKLTHPQSVFDDGQPRLMYLDIVRGLSMVILMPLHDLYYLQDVSKMMDTSAIGYIFLAILGAPAVLFANWKIYFIMISGIARGFVQKLPKSFVEASKSFITSFIGSIVLLFVFFIFSILT